MFAIAATFIAIVILQVKSVSVLVSVITLHPEIKRLLKFTEPAVLTAMWAPMIFTTDGHLNTVDKAYVISGVITVVAAIVIPRTLPVIIIGLISFGILRFFSEASLML